MFKSILVLLFVTLLLAETIPDAEDITETNLERNLPFTYALRAVQTDLTLRRKQKLLTLIKVIETKRASGGDYTIDASTRTARYKYVVMVNGQNASIKGMGMYPL